jgi:hypothetical protein
LRLGQAERTHHAGQQGAQGENFQCRSLCHVVSSVRKKMSSKTRTAAS